MIRHILFHGFVIFGILLLAFSPLISAMVAGTIAGHYGCDLDEGSVHPCIVNGRDIGGTLYTMGVLGWLALGTIPVGLIAIGIYLAGITIFYLARWLVRRKRQPAAEATPSS